MIINYYLQFEFHLITRDSLGGNCKTIMIATINPEAAHTDESLSTCRLEFLTLKLISFIIKSFLIKLLEKLFIIMID